MEIIYGSHNLDKVAHMKSIIKSHGFDVNLITIKDIGFNKEIIEDGKTFEENSEIKADAIRNFCLENDIKDKIIIADDAGLCVDKLNGEPGVYTSRYAGENASQEESINKLLNNLKEYTDMKDRTCKFVSVLTAILPSGKKIVARGECKGSIALKPGILGGLTYAPVFIPYGFNKPMSEIEAKDYASVHNHRDIAMEELMKKFKELGY